MSSIHDPRYRTIINQLVQLRENRKLTQWQIATALKKPQSYIAKVENCERRIDVLELYDWLLAIVTFLMIQ